VNCFFKVILWWSKPFLNVSKIITFTALIDLYVTYTWQVIQKLSVFVNKNVPWLINYTVKYVDLLSVGTQINDNIAHTLNTITPKQNADDISTQLCQAVIAEWKRTEWICIGKPYLAIMSFVFDNDTVLINCKYQMIRF